MNYSYFPNFHEIKQRKRRELSVFSKMASSKRKVDRECRVFKEQWTNNYFFVQCKDSAVCLVCCVLVFKEYNLRCHYESRHKEYASLQGQPREDRIQRMKRWCPDKKDALNAVSLSAIL